MTDFNNPFEISSGTAKSPITKYISWQGSEGYWKYRQKQEDGSYLTVNLGESIFCVPIVIFNCVTGWNSKIEASVRSNEVLHLGKELVVFVGGQEVARGVWKEIKNKVVECDGNFTVRFYAMLMAKGQESEIVVIDLSRSALSAWIDATPRVEAGDLIKLGKNPQVQKNGSVSYFVPNLENKGKRDETKADALALWPPVAKYLNDREKQGETLDAVSEEVKQPAVSASMNLNEVYTDDTALHPDFQDDLPF